MKAYMIRINTVDNLFIDYAVEANNLISAKTKAKKMFFNDFKDADKNIRLSLSRIDRNVIKEIMKIIKECE